MAARLGRSRPASAYIIRPRLTNNSTYGGFDATLGNVTMDFAGTPTPPSGDFSGIVLNNVTVSASGVVDGAASMSMQLSSVTADFAGAIINGDFAIQLSPVTETFAGSVNPIGDFALQLSPISALFGSETTPFGEHVIRVEPELRGLYVIDDDPGLIPIYLTEVTQL